MPSPTGFSETTQKDFSYLGDNRIRALLSGSKWGDTLGVGFTLTYSFPWTSSDGYASWATGTGGYTNSDLTKFNMSNEPYRLGASNLNATQQTSVKDALSKWANVANVKFNFVPETSTQVGDVRFSFTSTSDEGGHAYLTSTTAKAGDIWLPADQANTTFQNPEIGTYGYETFLHEIGHALGLKHTFESYSLSADQDWFANSVMSYNSVPRSIDLDHIVTSDFYPTTPMWYDIFAMQLLYGANNSYHTGNDVYTYRENEHYWETIWDAGGNDTINYIGSVSAKIDLRDGGTGSSDLGLDVNFSDGESFSKTITIFSGVIIENAYGGLGDDTLQGNDIDNTLNGGSGNDLLYGAAGNDSFDWDSGSRGGNDTMNGGTGDDTYVIDSLTDVIIENVNEGIDTIQSAITYSLKNILNVENLSLFGEEKIDAFGNNLDNILIGNSNSNLFAGEEGNDSYVFGIGSGDDAIIDSADDDFLLLSGLNSTDISFERVANYPNDLKLVIKSTKESLYLGEQLNSTGTFGIETFSFEDKSLTRKQISDFLAQGLTSINQVPTGSTSLEFSGIEDNGYTFNAPDLLQGFSDLDGDKLSVINFSATNATVTDNFNETWLVVPKVNYNGLVNLSYSVSDKKGGVIPVTQFFRLASINDLPTGYVTITGEAWEQGKTLTVSNSLADADGLGSISYQWLSDGNIISGANQTTYTLTVADLGKAISVQASYVDLQNTAESVVSGSTSLITPPVNQPPAGSPVGFDAGDEDMNYILDSIGLLNGFSDADGDSLSATNLTATNGTITLNSDGTWLLKPDSNFNGTVQLSYGVSDNKGGSINATLDFVLNPVNDSPTGLVTIAGKAKVGETLSVVQDTLDDPDGINDLIFTWFGNGEILGDGENFLLTNEQKDLLITVVANYIDDYGNMEEVTCEATEYVIALNHAPTGKITIKGDAKVGSVLSLTNTIKDVDGLGYFSYQWFSNGKELIDAIGKNYILTTVNLDKKINVTVSYIDGEGTVETVTSASTKVVITNLSTKPTNGNDQLTGTTKNDTFSALVGNDTLIGGQGVDKLTGGKGADIFKYTSLKDSGITTTTRDTITDFKHSEKDKIDLSAIDVNAKLAGDQAFKFIGSNAFNKTDASAQLRFDATSHILYGSTNADSKPEFSIQLNGITNLVSSDFML